MTFRLGLKSRFRLRGVKSQLVAVVERAIQLTEVDFTVLEGLRTIERQRQLVAAGASRTLNSRHLTGDAVDLGALVGGRVRWDWPLYYRVADAMRTACQELGTAVTWGGVWDFQLGSLLGDLSAEVAAYCARNPGKDFIDGPHYQLR